MVLEANKVVQKNNVDRTNKLTALTRKVWSRNRNQGWALLDGTRHTRLARVTAYPSGCGNTLYLQGSRVIGMCARQHKTRYSLLPTRENH